MKKLGFGAGLLLVLLTVGVPLVARGATAVFFSTNTMPPSIGTYISPAQWHALYANGIIISNVTHRVFTENQLPPSSNTSATHSFNSEIDFDLSLDHGATFSRITAPAQVTVNLQNPGGAAQVYNTEMLQLSISGGNLPAGVQVRASPSVRSTGQTSVAPATGGFMISSFFDIFTEVSTDGGQTWSPSTQAGHMDLRADPLVIPPVVEPSALVPPPGDAFASTSPVSAAFAGGVVIKNIRHAFSSQSLNLLTIGTTKQTEQFNSVISFQFSTDGGVNFSRVQAPATVALTLQSINPGPPGLYDTEMLQLDLSFPLGASSVRLRESPTLPSYGETSLQQAADGTFRISSFFDVFTELSLDGGQTWQPATNGPTHVELQPSAASIKVAVSNMPPTNGQFSIPGPLQYFAAGSGIVISNFAIPTLGPSQPLPPPGVSHPQTFTGNATMLISLDNGRTFNPASGQVSGFATVSNATPAGTGPQYYNSELVQLNISGGNLPAGLMIRESPTRASLGRVISTPLPAGGFRITSFFDVFTELSMDGGQTWNPGVLDPTVIPNIPIYPFAPYVLNCPANITVYAASTAGAVVNYSMPPITIFPDCPFCCNPAVCAPPSGSLFPIGTTTVNCYGSDGCGEHPTCSFTVTVIQSFIYGGLVDSMIGRALLVNSNWVTTNQYLVLSNLFADSADGATFNFGSADFATLSFLPFSSTGNCPTDILTTATGIVPGSATNVPVGSGAYFGGANPMIRADFSSLGATHGILEVHDGEDNHLVYSNRLANNTLVSLNNFFPFPCSNYNTTVYTYGQSADGSCYRFCRFGCSCIGTNCYIERVACWRPDLVSQPLSGIKLTSLQLLGAAALPPGSFAVQSEDLGVFGLPHRALGQATFDARSGVLMLNNIGPSGQDGVLLNLGHAGQLDLMLAPTMLEVGGALFGVSAEGKVGGMDDMPIGAASLDHVGPGGGCIVQDYFTPIGASQTRVEVYQDSQLIGVITEPTGPLGTMPSHGNLIGSSLLLNPPGFRFRFESPFVFLPQSGAGQLSGNELRILAANPTVQVQNLSQLDLQGANIPQLAIIGETSQPVIIGVIKRDDGTFEIDGQGAAGMTYRLEATSALGSQPTWKSIASAKSTADGAFYLIDAQTGAPRQQFYRVVSP
jgi:hypothetical protein